MQNEILLNSPPPPYKKHSDSIYLSEMDSNAWPSSYYGRTRRIDLAKFYHDILKASTHEEIEESDSSEEEDILEQKKKKVRFSKEPPTIFEYEAEYDEPTYKNNSFDDGWPGRTKTAMKSSGFIDFKSKIEAKLGAINDPSLISQLDTQDTNLFSGYYRYKKSPLVKNLLPIPNEPNLIHDYFPSPSNSSYNNMMDTPLTPNDGMPLFTEPSISNTSNNSLTNGGSKWLNRTLSRMRNNSPRIK